MMPPKNVAPASTFNNTNAGSSSAIDPSTTAAPVSLASDTFGPGNWKNSTTLTNLSAAERQRYRNLLNTANLIQAIHSSLPGYRVPNEFSRRRWDDIYEIYKNDQRKESYISSPNSGRSLDSTFQTQKRTMKNYIDLNASRNGPPPRKSLPNSRQKEHGGRRKAGFSKAVPNKVEDRDVKAEWGPLEEFEEEDYDFVVGRDETGEEEGEAVDAAVDAELRDISSAPAANART